MKTLALVLMSAIAISATTPGQKGENNHLLASAPNSSESDAQYQCGVSNQQIIAYLQGAPHYHTVYWVEDIPGTCNSKAGIENCKIATVYVQDGQIIGHADARGYCPQ